MDSARHWKHYFGILVYADSTTQFLQLFQPHIHFGKPPFPPRPQMRSVGNWSHRHVRGTSFRWCVLCDISLLEVQGRHSSGGESGCLAVGGLPVRSPALGVSKCP
ncbi:hypothetical protein ANANG_G00295850 [Anguilla anguilla]|uniref:Uncharacterized protein n=1 Tax=Anguilla anguilla TaxID=7936 RepID=A0A9D3LKW6_ANGAN|nr:hypothetical protein ANANG_G00295850 [Anguilla anguilla]